MMRRRKRHHVLHTWSQWSSPAVRSFVVTSAGEPHITLGQARRTVQDRFCTRCGVYQQVIVSL